MSIQIDHSSVDGDLIKHGARKAFLGAIGRFVWWLSGHDESSEFTIVIHNDGDNNLIAHYSRNGNHYYTIGAVWNSDTRTYSFHS